MVLHYWGKPWEIFRGDPPPHVWDPPRVGTPLPHAGLFLFSLTPHSPTCDMVFFPHKGAFRPLLAVKLGALAGHGTRAERRLRPLRGRDEHWHHEYTLQKGHTDRHIALRAV